MKQFDIANNVLPPVKSEQAPRYGEGVTPEVMARIITEALRFAEDSLEWPR